MRRPSGRKVVLKWTVSKSKKEPLHYLVYRFNDHETVDLDRADRILSLQQESEFTDPDARGRHYTYVVTALDRLWNESAASNTLKDL